MKFQLLSKTVAGKWAAWLTLTFIILILFKITIGLPVPSPLIAAMGIAGFVIGIVSVVKNKDKSVLTLLSLPVGLLIILWVAAEIANPH